MMSNSPNSAESLSNLWEWRGSLSRNTKHLEGPRLLLSNVTLEGVQLHTVHAPVSYLAPPDSFTICLVPDTFEFTTKYKNNFELTERILRDLTFSKYRMIIK